jgi:FkbM family methyltransferase
VAVEGNPTLCSEARLKFAAPLADGRLTLVDKALARKPGPVTFYVNESSVWSTIDPLWAERNLTRFNAPSRAITVQATTMPALLEAFGVPYYVKLDIEGFDMVGVEGLASHEARPAYVSIESDKDSFKGLKNEISTLSSLGYDRFKIVPQSKVSAQVCPSVDHRFAKGSSGCFGEEAPVRWMTAEEAIEAYRSIFFTYAVVGDDPVAPRWMRRVGWWLGVRPDWYDTHAWRSAALPAVRSKAAA